MSKPVLLVQLDPSSRDAAPYRVALAELAGPGAGLDLRFAAPDAAVEPSGELAAIVPEIAIWTGANLSEALLTGADQLRWVSFFSAGVDGKLSPLLLARRPLITTASGVHGPNVAEHLLTWMLALTHGFPQRWRDQAQHSWRGWKGSRAQGGELAGQTLAVVGLGHIGAALASRAKALEMRVVAVKRNPELLPEGLEARSVDALVGPAELDGLLSSADHVALCAPLTGETRLLFDRGRLGRMKRGSFLYNVARGGLIDSAALTDALQSGQLGAAGLDVFEEEPLPATSPLWDLPNVLITPHIAGVTPRYFERAAALFAANLRRFLAGEPLRQEYSVERGY